MEQSVRTISLELTATLSGLMSPVLWAFNHHGDRLEDNGTRMHRSIGWVLSGFLRGLFRVCQVLRAGGIAWRSSKLYLSNC